MYVIIVGGGPLGLSVAEELWTDGNEVLIIEKKREKEEAIREKLGSIVMQGDGTEVRVLEEAGAGRADVLFAVAGQDEDNLVACQIAKHRFKVPRTVALVNSPGNEAIFLSLGVDSVVSKNSLLGTYLAQEVEERRVARLVSLTESGMELFQVTLGTESPMAGRSLRELPLPPDTAVCVIVRRNGEAHPPSESAIVNGGDKLILLAPPGWETVIREALAP